MDFVETLRTHTVVAILRGDDPERVRTAAHALIEGGVSIVEVTFTVPDAAEVIASLIAEGTGAVIGAGTVTSQAQIDAAAGAGAQFLVSPGTPPALLDAMASSGLPFLPGTHTASEMMTAVERGAPAVKLFPANNGGIGYLRQLRAPLPDVSIVPSGGVGVADIGDWLSAGAIAVGLGSLASPAEIANEQWASIRSNAADAMAAAQSARSARV